MGALILVLLFMNPRFFFCCSIEIISHKNIMSILNIEFVTAMGKVYSPGLGFLLVRIFYFIAYSNFLGLMPYVFTPTRHLVPRGTPYVLMPFMVIIEIISISIRPLTLSVRLAANIIAGHMLIVLVRGPLASIGWTISFVILLGLILLVALEVALSIIQSYVFRTLMSLYIIEVNSPNF